MKYPDFIFRNKLHHLFFWMMLFGLWYFLRYEDYSTNLKAFQVTFIKVIDLALLVYFTNYVFIPNLLYKKKYGWFLLVFVLMIVISSVIKMYILGRLLNNPALLSLSGNIKARIYDNVIPHFFLVTSGAAIKLMIDYTRMQQRVVEMAKEKAEAELNFLKSQINPHFLFNTLNSVYFLIEKSNHEARNTLHKFSDMLRYQLYEMSGDRIPVEKEIHYLNDYIDLQKIRRDEQHNIIFNCAAEVKGFSIEPLLLIPFVENAFKHISHHKDQNDFIKINMRYQQGEFKFSIENSKENTMQKNGAPGGIGLENVKKRLALLYPQKHSLHINNGTAIYTVDLSIKI
ncbi:MAG: histidine kinase [Ferruginibacter sp.]